MSLSTAVDLNLKICADQVNHVLFDNPDIGIQMLDAWGKPQDSYYSGQIVSLGNYDQCVDINELTPVGVIHGKYCLIKLVNITMTFMGFGACVPDVCEVVPVQGTEIICNTKDSYGVLDFYDYCFLAVLAFFGLVMILSTIYDWYTRKHELKQNPFYIVFSVITNGEKLFETNIGEDQISCLAGLRVISMIWIICGHRYFVLQIIPVKNSLKAFSFLFSHESFYIQAAYLAVDTFLYLGGFVLAYQCFKNRNKLALTIPTIPYFYIHRILRILPPLLILYFSHLTLLRRLSSGPIWQDLIEKLRQPCLDHWLPYFLFIQNYLYVSVREECLPHTWYLNVDLQLYFFTPIILIPCTKLLKQNQVGKCYSFLTISLLLSIFIPMIVMFKVPYEYTHSYTRISPYIIGIMMGLFVLENKDKNNVKITKVFYYFMWALTLLLISLCVYYTQTTLVHPEAHFNNNMIVTFGRPAWGLSLSWIIFCCITGKTKTINNFLSNSLFLVMGRLSYSMYLLQSLVLLISMGPTRTPLIFSFWEAFHGNFCDLFLICIFSIVFVLSFESPIIAMTKLLLQQREPQFNKTNVKLNKH